MPAGENVLAVSVGRGWAAAATDRQLVRLFTASGLQVRGHSGVVGMQIKFVEREHEAWARWGKYIPVCASSKVTRLFFVCRCACLRPFKPKVCVG